VNEINLTRQRPQSAGTFGRVLDRPADPGDVLAWMRGRGIRGTYPRLMATAVAIRQLAGEQRPTRQWLQQTTGIPRHHFDRIFDGLVRDGVFRLDGSEVRVVW
jgi:hypothetical protein